VEAQVAWLKANMATHFSRKLLGVVKRIERNMGPRDGNPSHHFPRLAGSYLSEVRTQINKCHCCCDDLRAVKDFQEMCLSANTTQLLQSRTTLGAGSMCGKNGQGNSRALRVVITMFRLSNAS